MRWEDERYVRLYTRDTLDLLSLSLEAQGVFALILRKVDRAGLMPLGKHGARAVALMLGHPARIDTVEAAVRELVQAGIVAIVPYKRAGETMLVIPNFIEAQEAKMSGAQRQREYRERKRDFAAASAILGYDVTAVSSHSVTVPSQNDSTALRAPGEVVTPSLAEPSRAEPSTAFSPTERAPAAPPPAPAMLPGLERAHASSAADTEASLTSRASPAPKQTGSAPARRAGDPRHQPLLAALKARFEKLRGTVCAIDRERDPPAVSRLLRLGTDAEVLRAWESALLASPPFRVDTIAQLASPRIWNHHAQPSAPVRRGPDPDEMICFRPDGVALYWRDFVADGDPAEVLGMTGLGVTVTRADALKKLNATKAA